MKEKEQANYYAIIPANVRYDKRLKLLSRMLYGEITALSNEKGYCWANNKYFADLYEVSIVTISNTIKQLKEFGYIDIEIIYKENSKEIDKRIIKIASTPIKENFNTPLKKFKDPLKENFNTPLKENFKDNNTRYEYYKINNIKEIYKENSENSRAEKNISLKENKSTKEKTKSTFIKPTIEEITDYCLERNNKISAEAFYDYYESIGWKVGKKPMKDWKACIRTWERNEKQNQNIDPELEKILAIAGV